MERHCASCLYEVLGGKGFGRAMTCPEVEAKAKEVVHGVLKVVVVHQPLILVHLVFGVLLVHATIIRSRQHV